MKLIHNINKWSFIVTSVLYLGLYFGMIAQIGLGIIQVILAIILSFRQPNPASKRFLTIYWLGVVLWGVSCAALFTILENYDYIPNSDALVITFLFVIPMIIGAYFVYLTYQINKFFQENKVTATENQDTDEKKEMTS